MVSPYLILLLVLGIIAIVMLCVTTIHEPKQHSSIKNVSWEEYQRRRRVVEKIIAMKYGRNTDSYEMAVAQSEGLYEKWLEDGTIQGKDKHGIPERIDPSIA